MEKERENPNTASADAASPTTASGVYRNGSAPHAVPAGGESHTLTDDSGTSSTSANTSPAPRRTPRVEIGKIITCTWRAFLQSPGFYLGLAFLPIVSGMIGYLLYRTLLGYVLTMIGYILAFFIQAPVTYSVFRFLRGEKATAKEALAKGMRHFRPIVGASIVVGLLTYIGYVLMTLPGLVIHCGLAVTVPICFVERTGALLSLQRSTDLTKHYQVRIFVLLAAVFAVTYLISRVTVLRVDYSFDVRYMIVLRYLLFIIPAAFQSVMSAVLYYALREDHEGVTVESLAETIE